MSTTQIDYTSSNIAIAREKLARMCQAESVVCLKVLLGIAGNHLEHNRALLAAEAFERAVEVATELNIVIR